MSRRRGMTLVEVLVYITVLMMAYGLVQQVLINRRQASLQAVREAQRAGRLTLLEGRIRRDILLAIEQRTEPQRLILTLTGNRTVTWAQVDGRLVRDSWDGRQLDRERLAWELQDFKCSPARGTVTLALQLRQPDWEPEPWLSCKITEALAGGR